MNWVDAVIEAKKQMPRVTHYKALDGTWKPLVARFASLAGDWKVEGGFLVGQPYSNHAGVRLQLGRER